MSDLTGFAGRCLSLEEDEENNELYMRGLQGLFRRTVHMSFTTVLQLYHNKEKDRLFFLANTLRCVLLLACILSFYIMEINIRRRQPCFTGVMRSFGFVAQILINGSDEYKLNRGVL